MYVTVQLSDGLGNRFFQVHAMLGYAEKYGHTPVFVRSFLKPNPSHPGPNTIFDFFPSIPILDTLEEYETILEKPENVFTYTELPLYTRNVKLVGYFQSERYFPSYRVPLINLSQKDTKPYMFLHVRRGDFCILPHHNVNLLNYYRRALIVARQPTMPILVCSDDIEWCKANLPKLYGDLVQTWLWEEGTDSESLYHMAQCEYGGICANSTFSWWGAYFNTSPKKTMFMPGTWGYPPMPIARDIYPKEAIPLPV